MRNFIEEKIKQIQSQPDNVRIRTVVVLTAIATIIIVIVWVALLLPAQLRIATH